MKRAQSSTFPSCLYLDQEENEFSLPRNVSKKCKPRDGRAYDRTPRGRGGSLTLLLLCAAFLLLGALVAAQSGGKKNLDPASTNYVVLDRNHRTGQERFFCLARGRCRFRIIQCPAQCPQRKPKKNRVVKGCFADCSSRCETVCKFRKPNCNGYGSVCYDPRFVGGDGTMFYFHGAAGGDFALVSDRHLHINAHFIGTRPAGRSRDFTWVQALAVMFESHALVVGARRVAEWNSAEDGLYLQWDGVPVELPSDAEAEWRVTVGGREVAVERTAETNSVRLAVAGLVEMDVKVVPVGEAENRTHGYGIPAGTPSRTWRCSFGSWGG
ncbi:hypothetical protein HPP92_012806 [Vanilla planifolia]|uniref:Uncharacterized protein n=1 Tax=Vanilla planifolia TaxID=51239 RepID=A0A835QTC4_VANPL|nr:hypothetical protein HPP92_012806 [Vanilla planifolia]